MKKTDLMNWVSLYKQAKSREEKQSVIRKMKKNIMLEDANQVKEGVEALRTRLEQIKEHLLEKEKANSI